MQVNRPDEPAYAGGATFQKLPLVLAPSGLEGAEVVVLGAPMDDLVTNRPGTRFGPRAIRLAWDGGGTPEAYNIDLGVDPFSELTVVDHGDASVVPANAVASHAGINQAVAGIVAAGAVPIVLGGDHSIAYPDISAVAANLGPAEVTVVQFDTHADTATDIWGVKYSHGSPFRHLVDQKILRGDRLIQVGLRGYWPLPEEFEWMRSNGVRWHRMQEVAELGIRTVIDRVLEAIPEDTHLFLSVDVDALDPAFAPGTGTPEPGGMTSHELLTAVRRLVLARGLAGMEVVEVSPPYDPSNITATVAHRVVLEALSGFALHRANRPTAPENP